MKTMARAKAKKALMIANPKRKRILPASKGLTPEGDPLPDPTVIDLAAEDADEDAKEGGEAENAGKEPAKGDPVLSNDESESLPENPSKKKKQKGAKKAAPTESVDSSSNDEDSDAGVALSWRDQRERENHEATMQRIRTAKADMADVVSGEIAD